MFKTAITEMFGIKIPHHLRGHDVAVQTSPVRRRLQRGRDGKLNRRQLHYRGEFRGAIRETRRLTDKPFMVNITLPALHPPHPGTLPHVLQSLRGGESSGIEFSGTPVDKAAGMAAIEGLKKAGVRLFHKVGSVRHAVHAEKVGYDGVYAAGIEEGGHPLNDDVTTMVLVSPDAESVKSRWSP